MSTAADGPIVNCRTAAAYSGDKNVRLTCEVRARPGLTALFWIIDVNGTAVTEGVVIDEYWSLNMVRDSTTASDHEGRCRVGGVGHDPPEILVG